MCQGSGTRSTGTIDILMFTDDMTMMAETEETLQLYVETADEALTRWGLRVN